MTNKTNSGNRNIGHFNTGYFNTGNYNTGDYNTGNYNTGDYNTGNYNTGHRNAGNCNTGHRNAGNCNTGYRNTGHNNTGHYNTGDRNTGYSNTGYSNTGYSNTGEYNTGNHNTGDYHVGCFNTVSAKKAYYFNRLIDIADWDKAKKPDWFFRVSPTTWIPELKMTEEEKSDHPSYKTTRGYLRTNDMKTAWAEAYANSSPENVELIKALPAFDAEVFLEITGIDLRDKVVDAPCEGREVEIDGVTYVLKLKGETE